MTPAQCRAARALLDWSQQKLADAAGVGIVTVRQLEAGTTQPRNATVEAIQHTLEEAGVEFIDGNGGGPGARVKAPDISLEQFLSFLSLYEHNRLRAKAVHRRDIGRPQFGYAFVYHNRDGASLMWQGAELGRVRWRNGSIELRPPLRDGRAPTLSDDDFDEWVPWAHYRSITAL
jgi:transcriptional regulator with XRE-family HTH domain